MVIDTGVLLIHLPLARIGLALEKLLAPLAAPAGQKTDTGTGGGLVVDHEIGIVAELAAAVLLDEGRQLEPGAQLDQHLLEGLALAARRHHRNTYRIDRTVKLGDRPIQHRHHIVPLQVGGVRQHQIGEGHGL